MKVSFDEIVREWDDSDENRKIFVEVDKMLFEIELKKLIIKLVGCLIKHTEIKLINLKMT